MSDQDNKPPRNTPELLIRIARYRDQLVTHFTNLLRYAASEKTDRNNTAVNEYQMQVETAGLIRAAEDLQVLIRQLQEMWLFGELNTVGESEAQQQTDENAKVVAGLLQQLLERQGENQDGEVEVNGVTVNGSHS